MNETISIKLVAKKDFILGDMFGEEHEIKLGDVWYGQKTNMNGLKIASIKIGDTDMYYFQSWVEEFFEIIEMEEEINETNE